MIEKKQAIVWPTPLQARMFDVKHRKYHVQRMEV